MRKTVRLIDIAEPLGVSTVTVSKALSGQKGVSEEMRKKIVDLANELGYKQPSMMRKEADRTSYNIGVIMLEKYFDKYNSFYLQMYQYISSESIQNNSFSLLEVITQKMEDDLVLPRLKQENKVDGIIVIGKFADRYLALLRENFKKPIVYLDFCVEHQDMDVVISDSFYGAYNLTSYLFEMGHKDIAYVGNILETSSIMDRYLGYLKALMEHGCQLREDWIIDDRDPETKWILEPERIQLPADMPTAFVCNCDLTAGNLIKRLEAEGYKIPQDVSVVGYDNFIFPGVCDVEITTYEVDVCRMAMEAVNLLIKKMNKEPYRRGIHIIEGRLIEKDSVRQL